MNEDAVADTAVNLHHTDNVHLYEGWLEEILPALDINPHLITLNPPAQGLSRDATQAILATKASRLIMVSSDIATVQVGPDSFMSRSLGQSIPFVRDRSGRVCRFLHSGYAYERTA